jgi:uncharacterized membrane protein YkoI
LERKYHRFRIPVKDLKLLKILQKKFSGKTAGRVLSFLGGRSSYKIADNINGREDEVLVDAGSGKALSIESDQGVF